MTHILPPDAYYGTRRVVCNETGRYHRHKSHDEQFTYAYCKTEVVKGRDDFVNLTIFNPAMKSLWCRECFESIRPFVIPAAVAEMEGKLWLIT